MPAGQHRVLIAIPGWGLDQSPERSHPLRPRRPHRPALPACAGRSHPLPHPLTADLERLAQQAAAAHGLSAVGVEVLTHRIPMTVQVLVRRIDGTDVSLDDCAAFSGPLGEQLEAAEWLDCPYVLEVSSPGIGEELCSDRDFVSFRGFPVEVVRRGASGAERRHEGLLLERDAASVQLNVKGRIIRIPREDVVQVRLTSPRAGP